MFINTYLSLIMEFSPLETSPTELWSQTKALATTVTNKNSHSLAVHLTDADPPRPKPDPLPK